MEEMAETPEGEFVRFEDHERELARYKGGVQDWARKWETTQAELDAHKAMSKLVIEQLGASMTAAAERMKGLGELRQAAEQWEEMWDSLRERGLEPVLSPEERELARVVLALREAKQ
jgi:hypothetical protein